MFSQVRKELVSLLQPACRRDAVTLDSRPEFPEHVAGLLENSRPCLLHRGHRHLQPARNLGVRLVLDRLTAWPDDTCSVCRRRLPEDEMPLILWKERGRPDLAGAVLRDLHVGAARDVQHARHAELIRSIEHALRRSASPGRASVWGGQRTAASSRAATGQGRWRPGARRVRRGDGHHAECER